MWPEQNNKITDQVSLGQHITKEEVKEALRKMKSDKAVGPDSIPVEVWKSLGEDEVAWLTDFFNVIFKTAKMPQEWRYSTIIPLYKNGSG